jgi:hypothetical protein
MTTGTVRSSEARQGANLRPTATNAAVTADGRKVVALVTGINYNVKSIAST